MEVSYPLHHEIGNQLSWKNTGDWFLPATLMGPDNWGSMSHTGYGHVGLAGMKHQKQY